MAKSTKSNPDKIGIGKFWAWQSRSASGGINFIILSFLAIYCTDALGMPANITGMLLLASKVIDAVTDLFAGYLVDKTNSKLGKGRPYEFAILGAWLATWLMFSVPGDATLAVKSIWVITMYIAVQSICMTLLAACQNPYMVRAFRTNGQRVKLATFGGIVIMVACMAVSISFPMLMNRIATSPAGWSTLVAMVAVPAGLIGILRFVFVKETVMIEEHEEKPRLTDVFTLMRKNHYVWIVTLMGIVYSLVTGMGVMSYYFKWSVGNLDLMGTVQAVAIVSLPLLFFFPMIMKKIPMGKLVMFASIFYAISGVMMFLFARNTPLLMLSFVLTGVAALPITYLGDLMMIDCGSYNQYHGFKRMDGTIGAIKGFAGKLGAGLGSAILGVMLSASGYDGLLETQPDSAIAMINVAQGLIPAILFTLLAFIMAGYKLDLLMPKINKELEEKAAKA